MANKYTYSVPFTKEQLYEDYWGNGMSQSEIAEKYKTTQKVVWLAMKKAGINTRVAAKRNQLGERNSNWKGGRTLQAKSVGNTRFSDAGYWYIHDPEHPNATKNGYVAEHIKIATETLGRPLEKGECVHHKDLNKHNNSPDNLHVCNRKEHREFHLQLEMIAIELYRVGLVEFDNRKYSKSESLKEVFNACG